MGYGYSPMLSEGALKPPIFLTSTFVFETAQQEKDFFDATAGRRRPHRRSRAGAQIKLRLQPANCRRRRFVSSTPETNGRRAPTGLQSGCNVNKINKMLRKTGRQ
jgi:cystathionine beta-lyase/cystathionine gamma-synthase